MILDLNFSTFYEVIVSNAAVHFLTICDPVNNSKPVTHILVKEMTKLLHQSSYMWGDQRENQGTNLMYL